MQSRYLAIFIQLVAKKFNIMHISRSTFMISKKEISYK